MTLQNLCLLLSSLSPDVLVQPTSKNIFLINKLPRPFHNRNFVGGGEPRGGRGGKRGWEEGGERRKEKEQVRREWKEVREAKEQGKEGRRGWREEWGGRGAKRQWKERWGGRRGGEGGGR